VHVLIFFKKEFNNFWTFYFLYIIFGQQGPIYQQEILKIKILALFNCTIFFYLTFSRFFNEKEE